VGSKGKAKKGNLCVINEKKGTKIMYVGKTISILRGGTQGLRGKIGSSAGSGR